MIDSLPRREREIFEILCGLGEGTASAIRGAMTDPPSDSAVRALLARLVAKGLTNRQVGERLFISAKTVSVHMSNVLAKLGVSGRAEAVSVAHQRGLIGGDANR
jgi:predicted transcriptional regulator